MAAEKFEKPSEVAYLGKLGLEAIQANARPCLWVDVVIPPVVCKSIVRRHRYTCDQPLQDSALASLTEPGQNLRIAQDVGMGVEAGYNE